MATWQVVVVGSRYPWNWRGLLGQRDLDTELVAAYSGFLRTKHEQVGNVAPSDALWRDRIWKLLLHTGDMGPELAIDLRFTTK